ncbi:MAG: serine/threonine-protein phosphatase [Kitasatospora sp.]|nr:serine/threonine-protein phosphatase [Kitasatospora sp.]
MLRKRAGGGRDRSNGLPARGRAVLRMVPPLQIILGGLFYRLGPSGLTSAPFWQAAPLVAAPLYSFAGTGIVGATAIVANLLVAAFDDTISQEQTVIETTSTAVIAVIALAVNRLTTRYSRRLASARYASETAQRAVLPTPERHIGGLEVAARYLAADIDARIGGDMYAVQDTEYGVRIIIGDVRGKGLGAVEAVAVVIGAFREVAEQEPNLAGVARRLEHALQREGARREGLDQSEGFTTAVLVEIGPDAPVLRVVNRGHPSPRLLYEDGEAARIVPDEYALPLGMGELGVWPDEIDEVPFPPGTSLVLFTDGVTEARDTHGVFYDPLERMRGRIFTGPDRILDGLIDDVARHTGGLIADDMALLAIRHPHAHTVITRPPSA